MQAQTVKTYLDETLGLLPTSHKYSEGELSLSKYTAKVGQDNVNIGVVTIFRLANTSLLQVY